MWYNSGMGTETWLAISAGATFLLAMAASWAIWQNYTFRKEDRELNFKLMTLDNIIEWARKTRAIIANSLSEMLRYQSDIGSNLQAQQANLEAQLRIKEALLESTGKLESIDLEKELRSLSQELKNLESKQLTQDDIRVRVMSMLAEAASEYEFVLRTVHRFGEILQTAVELTGDALEQMIDSLSSGKYKDEKALEEYGKAAKKCGTLLGGLSLEAFSLKSLLLKYGSKLKL